MLPLPCGPHSGPGHPANPREDDLEGDQATVKVLFVCLGNICRSPLAEAVFRGLVRDAGLESRFNIDSAGTSGYHDGEGPDPRTIEVARRHGVRLESVSRRVTVRDLQRFDHILAMDDDNLAELNRLAAQAGVDARARLLREYDPEAAGDLEVPDPYFGGERGFERVQDIIERACGGLLEAIRKERGW
jgi:protein-tyrosine phosphatase